tara:strand:+ start:4772 stop:6883 length:2112 start_codon:yes stop_codon:yes gene_type:complete
MFINAFSSKYDMRDWHGRTKRILVIDNGTQYGELWVKRLEEQGVHVDYFNAGVYETEDGRIIKPRISLKDVKGYKGVVIAGGKSSVIGDEEQVPGIGESIIKEFNGPILGACLGHQLMAHQLDGTVLPGYKQCGPVDSEFDLENILFEGIENKIQQVNATHNDGTFVMPPGFEIIAKSRNELTKQRFIDAMYKPPDEGKNNHRIGLQFHPETKLTENYETILRNFVRICGLTPHQTIQKEAQRKNLEGHIQNQYKHIRRKIGNKKVFFPISGGIDSTTACAMLLEAGIKKEQIEAFHIDTGYNRLEESEEVVNEYHKMGWNFVKLVDKKKFFANYSLSERKLPEEMKKKGLGGIKLKDATHSEHKRILFQTAYAEVFEEQMKNAGLTFKNSICVQGTNQADAVESGRGGRRGASGKKTSAVIKTHHNVGEIFDGYKKKGNLCEPLLPFFKSDIYKIGSKYNLPEFFATRKPFPGPGLLIRMGNHNMIHSKQYSRADVRRLAHTANSYASRKNVNVYISPLEAVGTSGDERAEGLMAYLQLKNDHSKKLNARNLRKLRKIAGTMPHYTTNAHDKCLTRFLVPLFEFDHTKKPTYTPMKHEGNAVEQLQIFDHEVSQIYKDLGVEMTQEVNIMVNDNLGEKGKYTFIVRPWDAPDLMTGKPLIPDGVEMDRRVIDRLRGLKEKYHWIGNICLDMTYKPIGGTEIN